MLVVKPSIAVLEKHIKTVLAQHPEVELAILYGSFAQGKETAQSDIDLAIASKRIILTEERVEIAIQISKKLKREVDIVDLNQSNGVLLKEILTKGKVLLGDQDSALYFQLLKKHLYFQADFMPTLNMILKRRRENFIHET